MGEDELGRRLSRLKGAAAAYERAINMLKAAGDAGAAVSLLQQCLKVRAVQKA